MGQYQSWNPSAIYSLATACSGPFLLLYYSFGCLKSNFGPLEKKQPHSPMLITQTAKVLEPNVTWNLNPDPSKLVHQS